MERFWMDFDEGLPPKVRSQVRRTKAFRLLMAQRARVSDLAAALLKRGGTLGDPSLTKELSRLEELGQQVQSQVGQRLSR